VPLPRPNLFRLRERSLLRELCSRLAGWRRACGWQGFPRWIACTLRAGSSAGRGGGVGMVETARCWPHMELVSCRVLILLYAELMILALAVFLWVYPCNVLTKQSFHALFMHSRRSSLICFLPCKMGRNRCDRNPAIARARLPGISMEEDMLKGFRDFILRGNVVDLAVAVIIGAAFSGIVTSLVNDVLKQFIAAVVGKPDFSYVVLDLHGTPIRIGKLPDRQRAIPHCGWSDLFRSRSAVEHAAGANQEARSATASPPRRALSALAKFPWPQSVARIAQCRWRRFDPREPEESSSRSGGGEFPSVAKQAAEKAFDERIVDWDFCRG